MPSSRHHINCSLVSINDLGPYIKSATIAANKKANATLKNADNAGVEPAAINSFTKNPMKPQMIPVISISMLPIKLLLLVLSIDKSFFYKKTTILSGMVVIIIIYETLKINH